jgi:hypothetical protein
MSSMMKISRFVFSPVITEHEQFAIKSREGREGAEFLASWIVRPFICQT